MNGKILPALLACTGLLLAGTWALAADRESDRLPPVESQQVAPHIWYLHAAGGNMTALIGKDGILLVDSEFEPFVPEIIAKLKALGGGVPKFVVNTHYHQDHTGGNGAMHRAGATIIASANVRARLEQVQRAPLGGSVPAPVPADKLPTITFRDALTLYFDGETVRIVHVPPAHTDGDSVLFFEQANVLAAGDLFFNGMYPIIDVDTGGSIGGMIAAANWMLARIDGKTVVIPGHGPIADKAALERYRDMMVAVRDKVKAMVGKGMTLAEIQAAHPTAKFDAKWAGRISAERFVAEIYYSLRPHFPGT
ncbi:MAG: MBL fold metallo-hydrolase [Gammaproteobacteria bacterium]|nr:MBL fold metallo-hydrolase [Gammaproteobacteria bacterium]